MTTPNAVLRRIAFEIIRSTAPANTSLDAIYAAVEAEVEFDSEDLRPPNLHGGQVGYPSWRRNVRNTLQQEKEHHRLVNYAKGEWGLPNPVSVEQALDPEQAWTEIREAAQAAWQGEVVFTSPRRDQRYRITEVTPARITVERIDSNKPAQLGKVAVVRAIGCLNAAGGQLGRSTLINTVAKETAVVELHPRLSWSSDLQQVILEGAVTASTTEINLEPTFDPEEALARAHKALVAGKVLHNKPPGRQKPRKKAGGQVERIERDTEVVVWVLQEAGDNCELCTDSAPFRRRRDSSAYLEVHHVQTLAAGGPDIVSNAVALCPNCHRRLHHGEDAEECRERLYRQVSRLRRVVGLVP